MTRESSLWSWLAKARQDPWLAQALDLNRVENEVVAGMPDVEGFMAHRPNVPCWQFWIELKAAARPARASTIVHLKVRDKQVSWCRARWAMGGNVWFLIQVGSATNRALYLIPGVFGAELQAGVTEDWLARQSQLPRCTKLKQSQVLESTRR